MNFCLYNIYSRLTYENQADYLSKLYSFHENLNQQKGKYLQDISLTRNESMPASKYNLLNDNASSAYLSGSSFSLFRKQNFNSRSTASFNSLLQYNYKKDSTPVSESRSDFNRETALLSSLSIISTNTAATTTLTASTPVSNSKLNNIKIENDSQKLKPFKSLTEELSIGGKQLIEPQSSIPMIANAKIEYSQKVKPFSIESISRIKKMLNLNEVQDFQFQQQQTPSLNRNNSTSSTNNCNSLSNLGGIKLKLRESRLRYSLKNDNTNSKLSTIDTNSLLIHTLQSAKPVSESTEDLKVKPKLPEIKSTKENDNIYLNTNIPTVIQSRPLKKIDTPLTISGVNPSLSSTPKSVNSKLSTKSKSLHISQQKQKQANNHTHDGKCIFCNFTEEKELTEELKPLITIITTSKPSNPNFYIQSKTNKRHFYNENTLRSYQSPPPSPEILI